MPSNPRAKLSRAEVAAVVLRSLKALMAARGITPAVPVDEGKPLIGTSDAVLDSLGLVMLIVEIERELERQSGVSVALVSGGILEADSALENLGSLADHIHALMEAA